MIFELRMFQSTTPSDSTRKGKERQRVVRFTWLTCLGHPIQLAERLMCNFDTFQLLERHFEGRESTRDYGYGRGYEPIMVGSV